MTSKSSSQNNKNPFASSEQIFHHMFERHTAIMLLLDPQTGIILDANQAAIVFYGYPKSKICGMTFAEINALPPIQVVGENRKDFAEKENTFISLHKLASGEERMVEIYSSPVIMQNKQIIFSIIHDISKQRHTEQVLKMSEQFIYATINALSAHVCILDEAGTILNVNQAWRNFARLNSFSDYGLMEGANYFTACDAAIGSDAKMAHAFAEGIRKVIRHECSEFSLEYPCHSPDIQRWFVGKVTRFHQQKPVRVVVAHENITELKLTEESLRESKMSLQAVLQSSADGILATDSDNKVLFANDRFTEIWRISPVIHPGVETDVFIKIMLSQLIDPEGFILRAQEQSSPEEEFLDILYLNDGRVLEQLSYPLMQEGVGNGMVWSFRDITKRTGIESELRRSEERFFAISETAGDLIFSIMQDGTIGYVNELAAKTLGSAPQKIIGQHLRDIFPPEIFKQHWNDLQKVFKTGKPLYGEFISRISDVNVWQAVWLTPLFDDAGQAYAVLGDARDITERKQMEDELRKSEEQYRTIANHTYDWEAWRATDGSYLYISPSCERVSGYQVDEFFRDKDFILKIVHPDDRKSVRKHNNEFNHHSKEEDGKLDFRIITPEGKICWIGHRCVAVYGNDGRWLGRRESNRDITDRKQVEHELQLQRDFARQIINTMGQGLTLTDADGHFEYVNPAYAQLFGYKSDELIGKSPLDVTVPEDIAILKANRTKRQDGKTTTYETRLRCADGTDAHVLITGVPRMSNGKYIGSIAVITDLTEQKRHEEELSQAKKALEMANLKLEQALLREKQISRTDSLTGINNRGALFELAIRKFNTAMRYQHEFSILLFDVDNFKKINDTYGHSWGDITLKRVTQTVLSQIRSTDIIGRYGGDEFVVLLPHTDKQDALELANRIHKSIAAICIETGKGAFAVTISIGVAQFILDSRQPDTVENLFLRADESLYAAKRDGRNRTVICEEK